MRSKCCSASFLIRLLGVALLTGAIFGGSVWASGLSVGVRVQQDFYQPLVPVTKNFRTCFKTDSATGTQVVGICTQVPGGERVPAGGDVKKPQPQVPPGGGVIRRPIQFR